MNPIDFGGQRSKVKVMIGIIDKRGVHGGAMFCIVWISFYNCYRENKLFVPCLAKSGCFNFWARIYTILTCHLAIIRMCVWQ